MTNEFQSKLEKEGKEIENSYKLEDDEEYDYITVPPDGGFGWVVLVACFLINAIVDGFIYAFGAISNDIKKHFDCQEWATSLVISLTCGFYLLSAPLASALCNKWGCRRIGIIGSCISGSAVAASVLSPNIAYMWFLFGLIGGIGIGLVYLPSLVMVGYYFEEKRAIATGIVTAGTGVGSIIFPPLARFLFDAFGWKTSLFLLALILLGCALCCAFMVPLKPIQKRRIMPTTDIIDEKSIKALSPAISIKQSRVPDINIIPASVYSEDSNVLDVVLEDRADRRARTQSGVSTRSRLSAKSGVSVKSRQSIKADDAVRPLYKEDVLYQGDTRDLPEFQNQPDIATYIQETTKVPEEVEKSKMKAFWDIFLSMTNFHLLRNKSLLIICIANVFSMLGYYTPYLFIAKRALEQKGIAATSAASLISIIGFSNTPCRFLSGWVTKIPRVTPLLAHNIGLILAGLVTLLVPFCDTYPKLVAYCIAWGAFIAFHISLSAVIVCQIVGLELYSNALGLTLMFRGITSLAGPPLLAAISDVTKSFNIPFVISGLCFIICALMHFALLWTARPVKVEVDQKNKVNESHENPAALDV